MDDDQQFCLRWNNHQSTLISVFDTLLENQTLVDCTLAAEGKFLKAHKVVLSACSPYFATLLQEQYDKHPIFILKDVKFQELRAMMDYMYRGEVNISQDQLAALLKAAESLQIKGLSDNRSASNTNTAPKLDGSHHRNLNVGGNVGSKIGGGYTLEQTKRTRLGPNAMEAQEMSGSREGSSSPSRRRKKVRRRSIEAPLADIQHDNSNSSANQTAMQQSTVAVTAPGLSNVNPITAAVSVLAGQLPSSAIPGAVVGTSQAVASSSSAVNAATGLTAAAAAAAAAAAQQLITNVTKKTESLKGAASSENMNTEDLAAGVNVDDQEQQQANSKVDKHNHKHKGTSGKDASDIVVEPKSEYDDDGNEGTVEDLTLDEEDMGMDDLDQNAGTSHVGEGSSQGYVPWQHERSQDDLLMAPQDVQQRDPQDLSITRIAGLTWNEWNARLAMPLVTQLNEGAQPLIFPTDLSINAQDKQNSDVSTATTSATVQRKSPSPSRIKLEKSHNGSGSSTPIKRSGNLSCSDDLHDQVSKLSNLNEEEVTALMIKTAAEKLNCGNMSDTSYSEENSGVTGVNSAVADFSLCNINILNSISAMNSLIGAGGNSGLGLSGRSTTGSVESPTASGGGSFSNGHPCPDCGRVYKLKSSLRNHQKWECGKEPQFQCPFCVYRAKQKMHIGRHMERMHKEKFIKLEDLKSFTTNTAASSGVGGGTGSVSGSGADDSGTVSVATGLHQHFSN